MNNNTDQEPVELQDEFIKALDDAARRDEEGTLEYVTHEEFMASAKRNFAAVDKYIEDFERENPEYADVNALKPGYKFSA